MTNVWPKLPTHVNNTVATNGEVATAIVATDQSYAEYASSLQIKGMQPQQLKACRPPNIGKSNQYEKVKAVETKCSIDIFVSRLHLHTKTAEVSECASEILHGDLGGDQMCAIEGSIRAFVCITFSVSTGTN